jgi:hypothetical protein
MDAEDAMDLRARLNRISRLVQGAEATAEPTHETLRARQVSRVAPGEWCPEALGALEHIHAQTEALLGRAFEELCSTGQVGKNTATKWLTWNAPGGVVFSTTAWFTNSWEWLKWLEEAGPAEHEEFMRQRPPRARFPERCDHAANLATSAGTFGRICIQTQIEFRHELGGTVPVARRRTVPDHPYWGVLRGAFVGRDLARILNKHLLEKARGAPLIPG